VATTVSGRSFSLCVRPAPSAAGTARRKLCDMPEHVFQSGWPLTLDQQQNSVARDPGRYTRRAWQPYQGAPANTSAEIMCDDFRR
jgi:hypothetical protein